jgi:hypothetical protein
MHYMLFPAIALAVGLAWQSSAFASLFVDRSWVAAQDGPKDKRTDGTQDGATDEEPECD